MRNNLLSLYHLLDHQENGGIERRLEMRERILKSGTVSEMMKEGREGQGQSSCRA